MEDKNGFHSQGDILMVNERYTWDKPNIKIGTVDSNGNQVDLSSYTKSFSVTLNSSYAADTFNLSIVNINGISNLISKAKPIKISASFDSFGEDIISGRIETIKTSYSEDGSIIELSGKDWTADLLNISVFEIYKIGSFSPGVEPYIGEIVRDLILKYAPDIDATGVPNTPYQIDYRRYARLQLFNVIKELAGLIAYRFYVTPDRKLMFEPIPTQVFFNDKFTGTSGSPSGWTVNSGTWALSNNSYRQSDDRDIHTSYRSEEYIDTYVQAEVVIETGNNAGISLRIDGSGNMYYASLDVPSNTIRLSTIGTYTTETILVQETPREILKYNTKYRLRIFMRNKNGNVLFNVFLDQSSTQYGVFGPPIFGELDFTINTVLSYEDTTPFTPSGKIGLTTNSAIASFDNFYSANAYMTIIESINAEQVEIQEDLTRLKNKVLVQGAYEKFPYEEIFVAQSGTNILTLQFLPSEVRMDISGISGNPQRGGILGIDDNDTSVYFLVDYQSRQLKKRTGNWPNNQITVTYNRNIPIVGDDQDISSWVENGIREFVHTDRDINTEILANTKATALLNLLNSSLRTGSASASILAWLTQPGNYILVKSPSNNLNDYTMLKADSININFSNDSGLLYSFQLDNEDISLELFFNSIQMRLKKIERGSVVENLIRILLLADSASIQDSLIGQSKLITNAALYGRYFQYGRYRKYGNNSGDWITQFTG